jgi:hypothetical protein
VTAFFERYLMGRKDVEAVLSRNDGGLDPYYFKF